MKFEIGARATRNKIVQTLSSNMWQVICGNNMFVFDKDNERRGSVRRKGGKKENQKIIFFLTTD